MEAGLNLFSIRNLIGTPEGYLQTARALKEMGYTCLQHSGAAFDPELLARVTKETGLPIVLTHVPMDRILHDTDALMREHERCNCRNIGLGAMPREAIYDEANMKKTVAELDAVAEHMQKNGFRFFYHHHHFEFSKIADGRTVLQYMIDCAPHICFTLDTYWVQYGGGDIAATAEKLKGRISCVHLKDYRIIWNEEKKEFAPVFAPVGDGNIDFSHLTPILRECGAEHFLVEQDNAAAMPDPLGQVARSIRYIKNQL